MIKLRGPNLDNLAPLPEKQGLLDVTLACWCSVGNDPWFEKVGDGFIEGNSFPHSVPIEPASLVPPFEGERSANETTWAWVKILP